mmetsp:Transcript_65473/g.156588  ORF Transcript_65473/g.156588 Transcript_65473/m.156588 type:complete len:172 (-) Transcript_65473:43-558(-)
MHFELSKPAVCRRQCFLADVVGPKQRPRHRHKRRLLALARPCSRSCSSRRDASVPAVERPMLVLPGASNSEATCKLGLDNQQVGPGSSLNSWELTESKVHMVVDLQLQAEAWNICSPWLHGVCPLPHLQREVMPQQAEEWTCHQGADAERNAFYGRREAMQTYHRNIRFRS